MKKSDLVIYQIMHMDKVVAELSSNGKATILKESLCPMTCI